MTRKITAMVVAIAALATAGLERGANAAQQDEQTPSASEGQAQLGVGFHDAESPIGVRLWFPGQKIGLDLGAGFTSEQTTLSDDRGEREETLGRVTANVGVPFLVKNWSKVRVIARPGLSYLREDIAVDFINPVTFFTTVNVETRSTYTAEAELEAEVFLADHFSVSASQGFQFSSSKADVAGAHSLNSFGTLGNDFLGVGFHLYLWGNK